MVKLFSAGSKVPPATPAPMGISPVSSVVFSGRLGTGGASPNSCTNGGVPGGSSGSSGRARRRSSAISDTVA